MKPLKATILTSDKDLLTYQQKVKSILGIEFPLSYLKNGKIRAFLDSKGEILAGYAMITKGPFRTLSSIPKKVDNLPCSIRSLSEVTAMFIDNKVTSAVARTQFWVAFSRDLSTLPNKTHYIYAYDLEKTKLKEIYKFAKPVVLFEGRTRILEGMPEESDESIEVARCSTIMFLPFYAMPALINRFIRRQAKNSLNYFLNQKELRNNV